MLVKHWALTSCIDRLKHICIVLMICLCHSSQTLCLMMAPSDVFNISGCCIVVHIISVLEFAEEFHRHTQNQRPGVRLQ